MVFQYPKAVVAPSSILWGRFFSRNLSFSKRLAAAALDVADISCKSKAKVLYSLVQNKGRMFLCSCSWPCYFLLQKPSEKKGGFMMDMCTEMLTRGRKKQVVFFKKKDIAQRNSPNLQNCCFRFTQSMTLILSLMAEFHPFILEQNPHFFCLFVCLLRAT